MRSLRVIACAIFVAAFAAITIAPPVASAHTITPLTECRYPTANGDWFTTRVSATGLFGPTVFVSIWYSACFFGWSNIVVFIRCRLPSSL